MITKEDFITYPYTPDLTDAGIAYACHSLRYASNRMDNSPIQYLQRIVAGVAVEIAFRRYLATQNVPHANLSTTPFTNPDRHNISIGGRRCDIKNFLLINRNRIRATNKDPAVLLQAEGMVPVDQMKAALLSDDDIYIFAFLTALLTPNKNSLLQAQQASQPIYLIQTLPKAWARPRQWASLGKIALKSNATSPLNIILGGQGQDQNLQHEKVYLMPKHRTALEEDFYAMHYLHTPNLPEDTVGIHSPMLKDTYLIDAAQWGNIWVYGMKIIFVGYITRGEFRRRGKIISTGSRVFHDSRIQTQNLGIFIHQLHPLRDLFARAKIWRTTKK